MDIFKEFLVNIDVPQHRKRTEEVLTWVTKKFPNLVPVVKWNQPMFTDHGTYIVGFSVAKKHLAVSPELAGIEHFSADIVQAGYDHTKMLIRFPWDQPLDYALLEKMVAFNIADKAECVTFWRK